MDIGKIAGNLDADTRAKLEALSQSAEARALGEAIGEAELLRAGASGDEAALRSILRRVLSTDEGKRLAQMLGEAVK